jgi:hypothetical protein
MKLTIIFASMFAACSLRAADPSIAALQAEIVALRQEVAALSPLAALAPFITVDPNPENGVQGPHITFHGANVHIVDGAGATPVVNGTGNLFIGYDEQPMYSVTFFRAGSHNLIVGRGHGFSNTAYGNILVGVDNRVNAEGGLVAGQNNTINGLATACSITGGYLNSIAGGVDNVVVGGELNEAAGQWSVVVSGINNLATGNADVTVGGYTNVSGGSNSAVLGGTFNIEASPDSVLLGGSNVSDQTQTEGKVTQ